MRRTFLSLQIFLLVALTALTSSNAMASGVRLFAWQPYEHSAAFIIPVRANETPAQAARAYLQKIRSTPELDQLFANGQRPALKIKNFTELQEGRYSSQAVLLANTGSDLNDRESRITKFSETFGAKGVVSYVLPVVADIHLSKDEARDFRERIANTFSLMVAMGGDDIDPRLYNEPNRGARGLTPIRDESEIEVIRSYVAKGEGFLFGTCRGQQLTAVALGYRLIQDIPTEIGHQVEHADGFHSASVISTPHQLLLSATQGQREIRINTLHHESVAYHPGGPLTVAAKAPDGVIEALEFRNGYGLLVQFHPELMNNPLGERILAQVTAGQRFAVQRSCEAIFASKP